MKFTLRQLEIFVAVSRTGSVSRAANTLFLSQSATSTALGELERQYNAQLFDRAGKSLKINEMGRQILPLAVELLDRAEDINNTLKGHQGYGLMKIGATLTIGNYLATLLVAEFLHLHPDSQIKLEVHNTSAIIQQISNYELDIGLIEGACHHPDIEVEKWMADELVVFCSPDNPLAKAQNISMETLIKTPWILRERGSGTRENFDHAFHHYHAQLNIRLELEHTEAIKRAVESGLGIGCISRLALKDAFRRGSLVPIETPELDLKRYFYFLWHKKKFQTPSIREFLLLCRTITEGIERSDQVNLSKINQH